MTERDSQRILRQWDREIEEEARRLAASGKDDGPWKALVWGELWLVWMAALIGLISLIKPLR